MKDRTRWEDARSETGPNQGRYHQQRSGWSNQPQQRGSLGAERAWGRSITQSGGFGSSYTAGDAYGYDENRADRPRWTGWTGSTGRPAFAGQVEITGRREHWTNHDSPSRESLGTHDNWRAPGRPRRAEDRVDGISSVRHVQNNLRVEPDAPDASRWSEAGKSGTATPGGAPNGAPPGTSAGTAASGTGSASTATTPST